MPNALAEQRGLPWPGFDLTAEMKKALSAERNIPHVELLTQIAKRELAADKKSAKKKPSA